MGSLLVTGGAGFVGANFVHYWIAAHPGDRVVVLDALTYAGNLESLDAVSRVPSFRFVHGNIADQPLVESLLRDERIDTIVNFAAESHVDRSISGPDAFLETNVIGTHALLKAARRVWLDEQSRDEHRFHHVSTDEVYGSLSADGPAFTEDTPYAPNSPYSASKAAADHIVRAYNRTFGLKTTTSHGSNTYGPFHFPEKLIPLTIIHVLEGRPIPVYGDGRNVRDWLFVEDHCRGVERILERGTPGQRYNIGGHTERDNLTLVRELCTTIDQCFRKKPALAERYRDAPPARGRASVDLVRFVADRPGHDRRYAVDTTRISSELGFEPMVAFGDGLRRTVDWYLENPGWWQATRRRD